MATATMCTYPPSQHALPHWKCVFHCFEQCPYIDIPGQESDNHHSNTCPTIHFHFYNMVSLCTLHGKCPLDKNKFCHLFLIVSASVINSKLYIRKYIGLMETSISDFHTSFYIT